MLSPSPEGSGFGSLGKLQALALSGVLAVASSTCRETRSEVAETVAAEHSGGVDPSSKVHIEPAPSVSHSSIPETVAAPPKPKVLIANENVSEGLKAMAELAPGRSWLGKLSGNGSRDVMIYVPQSFEDPKPFELIYFFHGTGCSEVCPPSVDLSGKNFGKFLPRYGDEKCIGTRVVNQVMGAVERSQDEGHNQILVYPLSEPARGTIVQPDGSRKLQDLQWMRNGNDTDDSMHDLDVEAKEIILKQLGIQAEVERVTVKGHSAGGAPVGNLLQCGFRADRIDYLDATYWPYSKMGLLKAYDVAVKVNPKIEFNIFVHYIGLKTDRASAQLCDRNGELPKGVVRINANGLDFEGHKIRHGKLMRSFWDWERGQGTMLDCPEEKG